MRALILSALLAIGLGFATAPAEAAPISAMNNAVSGLGMIDLAQGPPPPFGGPPPPPRYGPPPPHFGPPPPPPPRCRNVRVCRMTPYGRRCHYERVCRRVW